MTFTRRQTTTQTRCLLAPCANLISKRSGTWDGTGAMTFAPFFDTSMTLHSWSSLPAVTIQADKERARRTPLLRYFEGIRMGPPRGHRYSLHLYRFMAFRCFLKAFSRIPSRARAVRAVCSSGLRSVGKTGPNFGSALGSVGKDCVAAVEPCPDG
jgi:hypothetical protein